MIKRIGWTAIVLLLAGLGLAIFLAVTTPKAKAHEAMAGWAYDPDCCNGNSTTGDCQQIPDTSVTEGPNGFTVTLHPGDHRLVTRDHVWVVPLKSVRWDAPDGHYHACLWPTEDTLRCFYAPPVSY